MEKGSRFSDGNIVIDEISKLEDENQTDDQVTMKVIQQIANSINPMIKLTVETTCIFHNGKWPVLDVQVNINECELN